MVHLSHTLIIGVDGGGTQCRVAVGTALDGAFRLAMARCFRILVGVQA